MNSMCIIGNLVKDPEMRATQSGISVCSFTVAVNKRRKDKDGNDLPPMFYRVTAWRQLAENCGKFLHKGSKVYANGDLSVSTYQRNDGTTGFSLEIDAQNIEFLSTGQQNVQQEKKDEKSGMTQVEVPDDLPF